MIRPNRVLVPVELDRPRNLRLNLNAVILIKQKTGLDIFNPDKNGGPSMGEVMSTPEFLQAFVWACCLHEDPGVTMEQIGEAIDIAFIEENARLVAKVLEASRGKKQAAQADPLAGPQPALIGSISGPSEESILASAMRSSGI